MKRFFIFLTIFLCFSFSAFGQQTFTEGALEFDATKGHHVNHGIFWKTGVNYGSFFWEAWVKPYPNAQYIISDGYGGAHTLLFGFVGGTSRLPLAGNIWSNATNSAISFGTDESVPVNEWCHVAVGWDGANIVTYINGIPSGIVPYSGQRSTSPSSGGAGVLFIGGSNHSNFNGKIARVRGFEGNIPMETLLASFTPEKYFRSSFLKSNGDIVTAAFLVDYSTQSKTYADLSLGFNGVNHVGVLSRDIDGGTFGYKPNFSTDLPTWSEGPITPPTYTPSSVSVPTGAIIYDSFNRQDTFWNNDGLGAAFGIINNTRVKRRWLGTYINQWGIFGEKAFNGGNHIFPVYVETGMSNMDVRVTRTAGAFSSGRIGVVYRYQDDNNYGFVTTVDNLIYLVEKVNGQYALTATGVQSTLWYVLQVVANGNSVRVLCNGVQVISTTTNNLLTATKAGIIGSAGTGERFDDFTVYIP